MANDVDGTLTIPEAARPDPDSHIPKSRDAWDKASILSGFVSSVVIAGVGLAVSYAIHQGQVHSAEEVATHNLAAESERQARALEISRAQLTNQVLEASASSSDARRALSVQLMFDVLPRAQFERMALLVARTDASPEVREHALRLLDQGSGADTLRALRQLADNEKRSPTERRLASFAAQNIAVRAGLGPATFVFSASALDSVAYESKEGGAFTQAALEALRGDGDYSGDGILQASELAEFVRHDVQSRFPMQEPLTVFTGSADSVIDPASGTFRRVVAVSIGISKYASKSLPQLSSARKDAENLVGYLRSSAGKRLTVVELYDDAATSQSILEAIQRASRQSDADSLLVVFFAGHGTEADGQPAWVATDFIPSSEAHATRSFTVDNEDNDKPSNSLAIRGKNLVSFRDVKRILRGTPARARLLLLDTCAASPLNGSEPHVARQR